MTEVKRNVIFIGDKVTILVGKNSSFTIPYNEYVKMWEKPSGTKKQEKRTGK
jgi:hypothetical protein